MLALKILGVYRHPIFSNNAIEADRLILEQSLERLAKLSTQELSIQMIEEENVPSLRGKFDLVLTMAQREDTLVALEENLNGSPVWNSSAAIRNCYRMNMSRALIQLDVGYVPYRTLATDGTASLEGFEAATAYWMKRSDFHAISNEDVSRAEGTAEMAAKLTQFRARGVAQVIVQKHIEGDIYKFYGVKGRFFRPIRVRTSLTDSFTGAIDFSVLEKAATVSADALGVVIYGGDAILDRHGKFHLIDLNDWPSFRICREDASRAIAELANAFLHEKNLSARNTPAHATSCSRA